MELGIAIGRLNSHEKDDPHRVGHGCDHVFYPTLKEAIAARRKQIEGNIKSHEKSATNSCTELACFDQWIDKYGSQ